MKICINRKEKQEPIVTFKPGNIYLLSNPAKDQEEDVLRICIRNPQGELILHSLLDGMQCSKCGRYTGSYSKYRDVTDEYCISAIES